MLRRKYTWQADLWSLGVILYILLSGMPPFYGDTEEQIFKMILRGQVRGKLWRRCGECTGAGDARPLPRTLLHGRTPGPAR